MGFIFHRPADSLCTLKEKTCETEKFNSVWPYDNSTYNDVYTKLVSMIQRVLSLPIHVHCTSPLPQFSALHSRGSSHGSSRITRRAYTKPYYIQMMDDSYSMWEDLERETGTQLFVYVCLLGVGWGGGGGFVT